jgi:hypothetical protein
MYQGCPPILFFLAACLAQEHANSTAYPVGGISIRAKLTSTIRAERVHCGDPVDFRTSEAIHPDLRGLVMPANTSSPAESLELRRCKATSRPGWFCWWSAANAKTNPFRFTPS